MAGATDIGWLVVKTAPQDEFAAQSELLKKGYKVFAPWQMKLIKMARRCHYEKRAYFNGYIFVYVRNGQSTERVKKATGVLTIVTSCANYVRVPGKVMEKLQALAASDGYIPLQEDVKPADRFVVGDVVPVRDGPFCDFWGQVAAIDNDGTITLWVDLFGRTSPLRIASDSLGDPRSALKSGSVSP